MMAWLISLLLRNHNLGGVSWQEHHCVGVRGAVG